MSCIDPVSDQAVNKCDVHDSDYFVPWFTKIMDKDRNRQSNVYR